MTEKSSSDEQAYGESSALERALKQFSLESERVELAYHSLKEQFSSLQDTLRDAQTKLHGKLAELEFTGSYLDAILSHISQGILFIDLNGIVTTCNTAAAEIFKAQSAQILFRPVWDNFDDDAFGFSLREALQSKKCPASLFTTRTREEEKVELEIETAFVGMHAPLCSLSYRQNSSVAVQGLLVIVRNITEFRRLQSLTGRYDRLKELGEMAARMAHEIRNPLGGIRGFASLLQQDLSDRPELENMAVQIVAGADSLNRFVSGILDYTRPFRPQLIRVDLIPFIEEILDLVKADKAMTPGMLCRFYYPGSDTSSFPVPVLAERVKFPFHAKLHSISLVRQDAAPCPTPSGYRLHRNPVFGDKTQSLPIRSYAQESRPSVTAFIDPSLFKSALLNLCINALQSMESGGTLSVTLGQTDRWVVIEVQDTGSGIPEENLDKIFSPFFTTKEDGNGLGLSEVHKIIQAHNGTIEVLSSVGKGSRFVIKIPLKI